MYKIYEKSKKEADKRKKDEDMRNYHKAKCTAKREVWKAQE